MERKEKVLSFLKGQDEQVKARQIREVSKLSGVVEDSWEYNQKVYHILSVVVDQNKYLTLAYGAREVLGIGEKANVSLVARGDEMFVTFKTKG